MICAHRPCEREVPQERIDVGSPYCTKRCSDRAKRARSQSPAKKRARAKYRVAKRKNAWNRFSGAVKHDKNYRTVEETESAQMAARKVIGALGFCAYENRKGFIRDMGLPKKEENRGRIFTVREHG